MGWKRVMMKYSTNFLSFLTKSTTLLRILTLKHRNEIKIDEKILVLFLTLKRANGLKTSYGEIIDKLLLFFDQKYHLLEILDTKTQKRYWNPLKKILVLFLTLKRANWLKTSYGEIIDKLLLFFYQKYHLLEILDNKTKKRD